MSGEPSSSLATTGQLDWVALSRAPISFTLEAISRIAKAGVEIVTVSVGSAICSAFSFGPEGQKEVTDSLSGLQGTGAFAKGLWFGFGVKSVASMLSETEQGACCVALCAALATPYKPFRVAEIWREMSKQVNAPDILTPSIHQWSTLVRACSGALARSHFPLVFHHFFGLLAQERDFGDYYVAPSILAEALLILAKISRGSMASAVFVGEKECALLAAIATCLLNLEVEILDEKQTLLFTSNAALPQVTFIRRSESENMSDAMRSSFISKKAYFVSGGKLLRKTYQLSAGKEYFKAPSQWATLFQDAFPQWPFFSKPSAATYITILLRDAAIAAVKDPFTNITFNVFPLDRPKAPRETFQLLQDDTTYPLQASIQLIRKAQDTFPELAKITPEAHEVLSTPGSCQRTFKELVKGYSQNETETLMRTAEAVINVVLLLSRARIHGGLCPSAEAVGNSVAFVDYSQTHDSVRYILYLFTETGIIYGPRRDPALAASSHGVCVFGALLENLDQVPTEALTVQVMPGHIQHNNHIYSSISSSSHRNDGNKRGLIQVVQMVIEESDDPNTLGAFYRLGFRGGGFSNLALGQTTNSIRRVLICERYPRDTSRNVSAWTLIRNGGPSTHTDQVDNIQVHQHRWCIAQSCTGGLPGQDDRVWEAELLALQMPALYLVAANTLDRLRRLGHLDELKKWRAILCMCCCNSCVKQLTHDVLQSFNRFDTIFTVRWRIISMQSDGHFTRSQLEFQRDLGTTDTGIKT